MRRQLAAPLAALLLTVVSLAPAAQAATTPTASAVSVGYLHTCGIYSGKVKCWGDNSAGQLGTGNTIGSNSPRDVTGISGVDAISSGLWNTCALVDGSVWCWGGVDPTGKRFGVTPAVGSEGTRPRKIAGVANAVAVAAGGFYGCALIDDGSVKCWGVMWNEIGSGQTLRSSAAKTISGLNNVRALAGGISTICAIVDSGSLGSAVDDTVKCWGGNGVGTLGIGTTDSRSHGPVTVHGVDGAVEIAPGAGHMCALVRSALEAKVLCWGNNYDRQLGNGNDPGVQPTATEVLGVTPAGTLRGGAMANGACVISIFDALVCWGDNQFGQRANGGRFPIATATMVAPPGAVSDMSVGSQSTCALSDTELETRTTTVFCWGGNDAGQLGDGTRNARLTMRAIIPGTPDRTGPVWNSKPRTNTMRFSYSSMFRLDVKADTTGVQVLEYSTSSARPAASAVPVDANTMPFDDLILIHDSRRITWMRVQDGAGNWSAWSEAS